MAHGIINLFFILMSTLARSEWDSTVIIALNIYLITNFHKKI